MQAIIELKKEVAIKFFEEPFGLDELNDMLEHMPYENFMINVPHSLFQSTEQVEKDLRRELGVFNLPGYEDKIKEWAEVYTASLSSLRIYNEATKVSFELINSGMIGEEIKLFAFVLPKDILPIPLVKYNEFAKDATNTSFMLSRLLSGVIKALNNPEIIKLESKTRVPKVNKTVTKTTKSKGITYISTTKIEFDNIETSSITNNSYNRVLQSWHVRGHFRKLKSGRKVWVSSYVKGKKEDVQTSEYKISK